MKRVLGGASLLFGIVLGCWVLYSVFLVKDPTGQVRRPFSAIALSIGMVIAGTKWLRGL